MNDFGDEIRYSNGSRVRNSFGDLLFFPNGTPIKTPSGEVRYPNGQRTRDSFGKCYYATGIEMIPCRRFVEIRDQLARGETAHYQLDIESGSINLQSIRFEFSSSSLPTLPVAFRYVILVSADLLKGRIDRDSIAGICLP